MIALVESIAKERERARVSIILDGIFKYLGKACSPRFLSAVTVTVRSIGRREGKKKKRGGKRERVHSRDATETFPELTRTSSLWRKP